MQVWSLGREDPLEKEMTTHSSILSWRIPWTEEPGGLQSMGSQKNWTWQSACVTDHSKQMVGLVSNDSFISGGDKYVRHFYEIKQEEGKNAQATSGIFVMCHF